MSIWQDCQAERHKRAIQAQVLRIVESQEQVATMSLVDTSSEQIVLENLLEANKPALPEQTQAYHYLIKTPFRYPPLRYGSRFGNTSEPGIFYASLHLNTALAECAYYRLVFLSAMKTGLTKHLVTEHTTFKVSVTTAHGLALEKKPFKHFTNLISDPVNYASSQQLGSDMRHAGIDVFTYQSARDPQQGINAGIYKISAIKSKKPYGFQEWLCSTAATQVAFINKVDKNTRCNFKLDEFLVDGKFPQPAT
ncbi:MAG TPA: RES domain-containing protein [Crenotrichaceae bacterium]|nr:RES domain-containing protein [Crenotrichaceae bacterium]